MVNNNIAASMSRNLTTEDFSDFASEWVAFALIENAAMSLDATSLAQYSIAVQISANFCYYPRIYDAFTQSLSSSKN